MKVTDPIFSSDLHFFHNRIKEFCPNTRQGDTVEEMNELIIDRWNKKVKRGQVAFILGDVSFGGAEQTNSVVSRLNGALHIIRGNHDEPLTKAIKKNPNLVQSYSDYKEVRINGIKFCLFHFPIESWNGQQHDSIHCHGHCHGQTSHISQLMKNRIDVGLDYHPNKNMEPFTYDEMMDLLNKQNGLLE